LESTDDGWALHGTAVFRHEGLPARLGYRVTCDRAWRARRADVEGWLGTQPVQSRIERLATGGFSLNGVQAANLADCLDVDLGFTPATNLIQLRRLALTAGQSAAAPAAWL